MGKAEFAADVVVANEYTLTGIPSTWNRQQIDAVAVEIKVGAAPLLGRTTVYVQAHPDNTGYVYIGFDNTVSAVKYAMILPGGDAKQITIPATADLHVWAIGSAAGQFVGVIEGKP